MAASLALAVAGTLCAGFLAGRAGDNSFERMGFVAFTVGTSVEGQADGAAGVLGSAGVAERVGRLRGADLAFYPLRTATAVLSPLLALALLIGLGAWLRGPGIGGPLVVVAVLGHGAFLLLVMPVLDDRFVLPGLPALLIAATLGWASLPPGRRRALGGGVLAVAAAVALDLHFGGPAPWNAEVSLLQPERDDFPPTSARGLSVSSSVEGRGWARRDETPARRGDLRDAVWEAVRGCDARGVGAVAERPLIGAEGDLEWVRYRALLDEAAGAERAGGAVCGQEGRWEHPGPLDVVLVAAGAPAPTCLGAGWSRATSVADPDGGRGVDLLASGGTCAGASAGRAR